MKLFAYGIKKEGEGPELSIFYFGKVEISGVITGLYFRFINPIGKERIFMDPTDFVEKIGICNWTFQAWYRKPNNVRPYRFFKASMWAAFKGGKVPNAIHVVTHG